MGKNRLTTSKNENHPLLNYLLESTTKRWNNFVITNAKDLTTLSVVAMCFHFTPPHSSPNWQRTSECKNHIPFPRFGLGYALLLLAVKLK
jgi:hypothetical protein